MVLVLPVDSSCSGRCFQCRFAVNAGFRHRDPPPQLPKRECGQRKSWGGSILVTSADVLARCQRHRGEEIKSRVIGKAGSGAIMPRSGQGISET